VPSNRRFIARKAVAQAGACIGDVGFNVAGQGAFENDETHKFSFAQWSFQKVMLSEAPMGR
jgi:hypothetical protein